MRKKGVSLIVLIVTIIVIIILAAVVILTLSKNNPIESAREAVFKEDVRTFQDELAMYIAKEYTSSGGQRDIKISATSLKDIQNYIPSFRKKYEGKFIIKNNGLRYQPDNLTDKEKEWCQSFNIEEIAKKGAEKAKENPSDFYGKVISYTTGDEDIDADIQEWKIFYSDGINVYIISSNYVNPAYLPSKDGAKPDQGDAKNYPRSASFNNIILKYDGSANITDEKMKAFNSDYFDKNYSSGNNNMRSVAYMLDKDIWGDFVNTTFAEYAVGGPSVEMTLKSYSEKNKQDYRARAVSSTGYQISRNGGVNWAEYYSGILGSDDLYVLSQNKGADGMWLSSPSGKLNNYVRDVAYNGNAGSGSYNDVNHGFRPLVCLNSDILLTWNKETQKYGIE